MCPWRLRRSNPIKFELVVVGRKGYVIAWGYYMLSISKFHYSFSIINQLKKTSPKKQQIIKYLSWVYRTLSLVASIAIVTIWFIWADNQEIWNRRMMANLFPVTKGTVSVESLNCFSNYRVEGLLEIGSSSVAMVDAGDLWDDEHVEAEEGVCWADG